MTMAQECSIWSRMLVLLHDDDTREVHTEWSEHSTGPASLHVGVRVGPVGNVTFAGRPEHVLQLLDDMRAAATAAIDERYPVPSFVDELNAVAGE